MRPWLMLIFLAGGLIVGTVAAQEPVPILSDPAGDVELTAEDNPAGDPGGMTAIDLRSLEVIEERQDLTFILTPESLPRDQDWGAIFQVGVNIGEQPYLISLFVAGGIGSGVFAELERYNAGTGEFDTVGYPAALADEPSHSISVILPRELLIDPRGAAPYPGMVVNGFWAASTNMDTSNQRFGFTQDQSVMFPKLVYSDRMPDQGNSTLPFPITLGVEQTGTARLAAEVPMRASNGEATTFVFELEAVNIGDANERFDLRTVGAPGEWVVETPLSVFDLAGGMNLSVPIIVTTPFAHSHGDAKTFIVEMRGQDTGSTGRVEIGVRYNAIPQPAGHHDTLYIHSVRAGADTFRDAFETATGNSWSLRAVMNADEDYVAASDEDVPGQRTGVRFQGDTSGLGHVRWTIPLAPGLEMGLDTRPGEEGQLIIPVKTQKPLVQATFEAWVVHSSGGAFNQGFRVGGGPTQPITIASIGPEGPLDIGPFGEHQYELTFTATQASDLIEYNKDASLWLVVNMTYVEPELFGPSDLPTIGAGTLQLPLDEYRDPVHQIYSSAGNLVIHADSDQDRVLNPGGTALYRFRVMDHGGADGWYRSEVTGALASWATVLDGTRFNLAKDGMFELTIALTAPEDAPDGSAADLVLQVTNEKDDSLRSLARFAAVVDADLDHEDDQAQYDELVGAGVEDSPGLWIVATLGALLVASRRR